MGNYYGVARSNDYLAHFGIFGMKWGVRRYQNKDGTLTAEGKLRYQSDGERINLSQLAQNTGRKKPRIKFFDEEDDRIGNIVLKIRKHPAIQASAKSVAKDFERFKNAQSVVQKQQDAFYKNKKLHEKYLNKAVDLFMKNEGPKYGFTRKRAYEWFKYDDGDQGARSSIELYKRSPGGRKLAKAHDDLLKAHKNYRLACEKSVSNYTGRYGNSAVIGVGQSSRSVNATLGDYVYQIAAENYKREHEKRR